MNTTPPIPFSLKKLTCALATLSLIPPLWAAPEQGQVISGQGSIEQHGKNTLIQQASERLNINWQNFDVNSDERVQFIQPQESSIAFNRILSNKGSLIQGRIDANGQVVLINPNGIIFTDTASVNVGALVASGLDIKQEDFLNSQFTLNALEGTGGQVINSGLLTAATGGSINLLGTRVENNGLISANLGSVNLAAGKEAVLTFERDGLIGVRVSQAVLQEELGVDAAVVNTGDINAQGGKVLLTASVSKNIFSQAVNVGELNPAKSAVVNADGSFTLGAGADLVNKGAIAVGAGAAVLVADNIHNSGHISADNAAGNAGAIELNTRKTALSTGTSRISARADTQGTGGDIKILGAQVGLLDAAQVDASGVQGGGQVLIGGDKTGANSLINNAEFTYVSEDTQLRADALHTGQAGTLIVFAEDSARIHGHLSVQGGEQGNGGFVETSGLKSLEVWNAPDISAAGGTAGHWLIDPYNIEIVSSAVVRPDRINTSNTYTNSTLTQAVFTSRTDTAQIGWNTIRNVLDNGSGGTVEIKTSGGSNAGGTIKVAANFDFSSLRSSAPQSGFNSSLLLTADKNIVFTDSVTYLRASANNRLNLNFTAQSGINFNRTNISTNGGNLSAFSQNGDITSKATLTTARAGEMGNNSGKIQFAAATGSIVLNTLISAGTQVFTSTGRGGSAGAIDLQANQGAITLSGTLSNTAGYNRVNTARHGAGAAVNLSAAHINTQAINTSANTTHITASEDVRLGAFNSNTNCSGLCDGDLTIRTASPDTSLQVSQSAAWTVKGNTQLALGLAGQADLPQVNNQFDARNSGKTIAITAEQVRINSRSNLRLADTHLNELRLTTLGNLTQAAGTRIEVSGESSLSAEAIELTEANNDFGHFAQLSAQTSIALSDSNSLSIGDLTSRALTLNTQGEAAFNGTLTLNAATSLTQQGPGGIRLDDGFARQGTGALMLRATASGTPLTYAGSGDSDWRLSAPLEGQLSVDGISLGQFVGFDTLVALGAGTHQLTGTDQDNQWRIGGNRSGSLGSLRFSGMTHLNGGAGADRFELARNSDSSVLTYDGGAGEDTLVNNWLPYNAWHLTGAGQGYVTGAQEAVRVNGFSQMERLQGYDDRLYGPAADNQWAVTGTNAGTLNGQLSFSGMAKLIGNSERDHFVFSDGKFITEGVSGGAGSDELIAAASLWSVSLEGAGSFTYPSSSVKQVFSEFETLSTTLAGTLTGPVEGGTWLIGGNNSVSLGGLTFNGMTSLQGNSGADRFELQRNSDSSVLSLDGGEGNDSLVNNWLPFNFWYLTGPKQGYVTGSQGAMRVEAFGNIEYLQGMGDRLYGGAQDNQWRIGARRSSLNGLLSFSGMSEVFGGSGNDRFVFSPGAFIYDGVTGGAGLDELIADGVSWTSTGPDRGYFTYNGNSAQQVFRDIEVLGGSTQEGTP